MFGLSFQSDAYGLFFFSLGLGRRQCWREERDSEILLFNDSVVSDSLATLWSVAHQAPLPMGILQARILEWIAISFSRGSFQPRGRTCISCRFFTTEPPGKPPNASMLLKMRRKVGCIGATFVSYTRSCSRFMYRWWCGHQDLGSLWTLTFSYPSSPSGLMALLPRQFSTLSLCWTVLTHSVCIGTFSAD